MNADRNLLFGILAFQTNFIDQQALVAALNRWTTDKTTSVGDHLVAVKSLDERQRKLLDVLVDEHLRMHGNDPEKSPAAIRRLRKRTRTLLERAILALLLVAMILVAIALVIVTINSRAENPGFTPYNP